MNIKYPYGIIVAGVGGQGAITVAQIILKTAFDCNHHAVQSEVHGMSQRGGSVSAQILIDQEEIISPLITEGQTDLLIGLEPLETIRYGHLVHQNSSVITSLAPLKNFASYPPIEEIESKLEHLPNLSALDTKSLEQELGNRRAGNLIILGLASTKLAFAESVWVENIKLRFKGKNASIIEKSVTAFLKGRELGRS